MSDDGEFGPAMSGLTERQRLFVLAIANGRKITGWRAADKAGYTDGSNGGDPSRRRASLRVAACRLLHDGRIKAALAEVAGAKISLAAVGAAGFLEDVRCNAKLPIGIRLRAAESLLDRGGLIAPQKIDVKHDHRHTDMTGEAIRKEIERLAAKVGMDPVKLLGGNVVEGEFTEVKGGEPSGS